MNQREYLHVCAKCDLKQRYLEQWREKIEVWNLCTEGIRMWKRIEIWHS